MKKIILPITLLLTSFLHAQLHQSILAHANDIPALPASSTEAATKCTTTNIGLSANSDAVLKTFSDKHIALQTQLNNMSTAATGTPSMPDTAMFRNVQNMNPDQQRAWAMQYAAQQQAAAASQNVVVPSAAEMKFNADYSKSQQDLLSFNDSIQSWPKIIQDLNDGLEPFNTKRKAELDACPQISAGGETGPDPVCARGVEQRYQTAIREFYTKWLQEVSGFLSRRKAEMNTRYSGVEADLVTCNYMDNPSQKQFKTNAISLQTSILAYQLSLAQMVADTWAKGCDVEDMVAQSKARY